MLNLGFNFYSYLKSDKPEEAETKTHTVWKPKSISKDIPEGELGQQIRYGHRIIKHTSTVIGPLAKDENLRFAGNNLSCNNCHLDAGRKIGSGSFIGVTNRFPQFRGRENKKGTIEDRINGCMERSMNGNKMQDDSKEMQAIVVYMEWLSEGVPKEVEDLYKGYMKIEIPEAKADTTIGRTLYDEKCMRCHMPKGTGYRDPNNPKSEYIYPPLAGNDSYNDGAGMNRVITAAEFIKANMPYGATYDSPQLTDQEAYHIAAYINSFPRPEKLNKELDFPKVELKPVSTPYGPWADDFSPEQHKYGPFQPIMAYYQEKYGIKKTK